MDERSQATANKDLLHYKICYFGSNYKVIFIIRRIETHGNSTDTFCTSKINIIRYKRIGISVILVYITAFIDIFSVVFLRIQYLPDLL